jgi:hypothetical protein
MVVFGDAVMHVTSVNGGVIMVSGFMIAEVALLVMGEVRSPYCHTCQTKNRMRPTKQRACLPSPVQKWLPHMKRAERFIPQAQ